MLFHLPEFRQLHTKSEFSDEIFLVHIINVLLLVGKYQEWKSVHWKINVALSCWLWDLTNEMRVVSVILITGAWPLCLVLKWMEGRLWGDSERCLHPSVNEGFSGSAGLYVSWSEDSQRIHQSLELHHGHQKISSFRASTLKQDYELLPACQNFFLLESMTVEVRNRHEPSMK